MPYLCKELHSWSKLIGDARRCDHDGFDRSIEVLGLDNSDTAKLSGHSDSVHTQLKWILCATMKRLVEFWKACREYSE